MIREKIRTAGLVLFFSHFFSLSRFVLILALCPDKIRTFLYSCPCLAVVTGVLTIGPRPPFDLTDLAQPKNGCTYAMFFWIIYKVTTHIIVPGCFRIQDFAYKFLKKFTGVVSLSLMQEGAFIYHYS